jgi:hypothetical protein
MELFRPLFLAPSLLKHLPTHTHQLMDVRCPLPKAGLYNSCFHPMGFIPHNRAFKEKRASPVLISPTWCQMWLQRGEYMWGQSAPEFGGPQGTGVPDGCVVALSPDSLLPFCFQMFLHSHFSDTSSLR